MQTGFYNATGGMVTQFNRLDVLSNNLANLNTNGFKRDDVVIGDFLRLYKEAQDELPLRNHTKEASQYLERAMARVPQIVEGYTDRSIGAFMQTGNPLDFALQGENLYFAVQTPQGVRYTRDGAFSLDGEGNLVTKEGFAVLPRESVNGGGTITLPTDKSFSVDKDGVIYLDGEPAGALAIVRLDNPKYLQKEGGNLYKNLKPENVEITTQSRGVRSGFIEKSNINAVTEMVGLIETNRLVDMYQKVMKSHSEDLDTDAIGKLGVLKA